MKKIITACCLGGLLFAAVSADMKKNLDGTGLQTAYVLSAQLLPGQAPALDGKIGEQEWSKAAKISGFCFYPVDRGMVDEAKGEVYLAGDTEYLYIGVRTSTPNMDPGGGLAAFATEHDGAVYNDDSVEVAIQNPADPDKVYHLIVNSRGTVFDRIMSRQTLSKDVGFNFKGLKIGTQAQSGIWDLEIAIPLSELGGAARYLKLNVARNWNGRGASALIATGDHLDVNRMVHFRWRPGAPVPRQELNGSSAAGEWGIQFALNHIPDGRKYAGGVQLIEKSYPRINGKIVPQNRIAAIQSAMLESGKSVGIDYQADNRLLHLGAVYCCDAETGEVIFQRGIMGKSEGIAAGRFPVTASFDLKNTGSGVVRHYPGFGTAGIEFRPSSEIQSLHWRVTAPDGQSHTVPAVKEKRIWRAVCPLGKEPGNYRFQAEIMRDGKAQVIADVFSLSQRSYAWSGNQFGKAPVIVAPFVPVKVQGRELQVLLSRAEIGTSGLYDSVKAKGTELLAAPMKFQISLNGKEVQTVPQKSGLFVLQNNGISAAGTGTVQADSVTLHSEAFMEYDGFFWNRITLKNPQKTAIDKVTLVIPFRKEQAELFHAVVDGIRANPAGRIPDGRGEVWNGSGLRRMAVFGRLNLHPQFVPYIWIGGAEKGLSFFMNSSYGTRLAENRSAMRIVRQGNQVVLEADFINLPDTRKEITFEFGLMATPVKECNPELRGIFADEQGRQIPGMKTAFWLDMQCAGFIENWSKFPHGNDFRLCDAAVKMLSEGSSRTPYRNLLEQWKADAQKCYEKPFSALRGADPSMTHFEHWKMVRDNYLKVMLATPEKPMLVTLYSDPRLITNIDPTAMYFRSEWANEPLGYITGYRAMLTPSLLDYLASSYREQIRHGIKGIYLDDMFIIPDTNPDTQAKRDEYGFVHADCGLLAMRELVKRIAVMQHEAGDVPRFLEVHMTNALLVPVFSLATVQLGWESHYGEKMYAERYPADYIRIVNTGSQIGALPLVLCGSYRKSTSFETWKNDRFLPLSRSQLSMMLPHWLYPWTWISRPAAGIDFPLVSRIFTILSRFGCLQPDCRFVPYYENPDDMIHCEGKDLLVSSWRNPEKLLAVISNTSARKQSVSLKVKGMTVCRDAETGKSENPAKFEVNGNDFRLLEFELKP